MKAIHEKALSTLKGEAQQYKKDIFRINAFCDFLEEGHIFDFKLQILRELTPSEQDKKYYYLANNRKTLLILTNELMEINTEIAKRHE